MPIRERNGVKRLEVYSAVLAKRRFTMRRTFRITAFIVICTIGPAAIISCDKRVAPNPRIQKQYTKLLAAYDSIQAAGQKIAARNIDLAEIRIMAEVICEYWCQADHKRCILRAADRNFEIPGYPDRAPKEFSFDVPDCEEPDCQELEEVDSGRGLPGCAEIRDKCLLKCKCKSID